MNLNLIKQLSDQARENIPKNIYEPNDWIDQYNINLTKLIINEFVQLCEQGTQTQTTGVGAAQMIIQHFDIEND